MKESQRMLSIRTNEWQERKDQSQLEASVQLDPSLQKRAKTGLSLYACCARQSAEPTTMQVCREL